MRCSAGVRRARRKECDLAAEIVRVCVACAAPSPPMTRNFCDETRASFLQILHRTHVRRAQKELHTRARSAGKRAILAQKVVRVCVARAAPPPPMTRNFCDETRASLLQILRWFCKRRVKKKRKKCVVQLAGIRFKLRGCTLSIKEFYDSSLKIIIIWRKNISFSFNFSKGNEPGRGCLTKLGARPEWRKFTLSCG